MPEKIINITLALAGVVQAATLIDELAQRGVRDEEAYLASMQSIFKLNTDKVSEVFGGINGLRLGLKKLKLIYMKDYPADSPVLRYLFALLRLERKISRSKNMLNTIATRIQQLQKQVEYFSLTHPTVTANLADIYLNVQRTFRFRLMVMGNPRILSVTENLNIIRALLLAGMRSAVLWHHLGGSQLHLLFSRRKIRAATEHLLREIG